MTIHLSAISAVHPPVFHARGVLVSVVERNIMVGFHRRGGVQNFFHPTPASLLRVQRLQLVLAGAPTCDCCESAPAEHEGLCHACVLKAADETLELVLDSPVGGRV